MDNEKKELEKIFKGKFPWNIDDYGKTMRWHHELMLKPLDDWDLSEKGILIKKDGVISKLTINKLMPDNQLAGYMIKQFGPDTFKKQFVRFYEITDFIRKHIDELTTKKLLKKKKGHYELKSELIEALCVLPFSKEVGKGKTKKYKFDYDEVIQKTNAIKSISIHPSTEH